MRRFLLGLSCFAIAGCASDYSLFYTRLPTMASQTKPYEGEPIVVASTGDPRADVDAMFTRGFGPIGFSAFNGPVRNLSGAIAQAKTIKAEYVVVSRKYAQTVQSAIAMTTLAPRTTYTNGFVNAGYASGTFSGMSTSFGLQTSYMPFSVAQYEQTALFFGPFAKRGLGILMAEISSQDAQRLGTQKGVIVAAVRRGSPAFEADMLPGDVVSQIDGQPVYDPAGATAAIHNVNGSDMAVTLVRDGHIIQKIVHLPPGGAWN
jgi:S1-C subfamily serine protease